MYIKDRNGQTYTMTEDEFCERASILCEDLAQRRAAYRFLVEGWSDVAGCAYEVMDIEDHHSFVEAFIETADWACEEVTGASYERYWTSDPQ